MKIHKMTIRSICRVEKIGVKLVITFEPGDESP